MSVHKILVFIFAFFIFFFTFYCTSPRVSISPEQIDNTQAIRLRILSYNIHYGTGRHHFLNLRRIAKVIRSVNPDIVALQEVDNGRSRTRYVDQLAELAKLTDLIPVFGPNIWYDNGGEYGNAVLSRFTVIHHENHMLPRIYASQRSVLEVELGISDDFRVHFFSTHLESGKEHAAERIASANTIEEIVQATLGSPMILAGDLNDTPGSSTLSTFKHMWGIASDGKELETFPSIFPSRQIDYIIFHPKDQWKILEVRVIPEMIASDHRPILTVLEFVNKKE